MKDIIASVIRGYIILATFGLTTVVLTAPVMIISERKLKVITDAAAKVKFENKVAPLVALAAVASMGLALYILQQQETANLFLAIENWITSF